MKILIVTPWYKPSWKNGGTVTAATNYVECLLNLGHEVKVLTTLQNGDEKLNIQRKISDSKLSIIYNNCFLKFKGAAYSPGLIYGIIRNWSKYDIVHIHGTRTLYEIFIVFMNLFKRKTLILTPHASLMSSWRSSIGNVKLVKFYHSFASKYFYTNFNIHYLSRQELSESQVKSKKSFVIPNCVDQIDCKRATLNYHAVIIGRVHPQKAIERALHWLKFNPNWKIDIIGPIDDEKYYNQLIIKAENLKVENRINWKGFVEHQNLMQSLNNYCLLLMPSLVEGVSMTMIECFSVGIPVICSENVANSDEVINYQSGKVVSDWSLESSFLKLDDSLLKEWSDNALKLYDSVYSTKAIEKSWSNQLANG